MSNFPQPVAIARRVALHPVAIPVALTTGAVLAGIIDAIVAVPLGAVAARVGGYVPERGHRPQPAAPAGARQPKVCARPRQRRPGWQS